MIPARLAAGLTACLLTFASNATEPGKTAAALSDSALAEARALRQRALADDTAYELTRSLTTEVGPRLAGSPGDARAVAWAVAKLQALGFSNVRAEPVTVPRWIRGEARAEITTPWPQVLAVVALGGSVGTPAEGIEAEIVPVSTLDDLKAQPRERIAGRIVFFTPRMERSRDGHGYGRIVAPRSSGAAEAAKLGAVAMVMRSAGTSVVRTPHTGAQHYSEGIPPIPAFALSNPDADMLEQQLASGQPVRLRVTNSSRWDGEAQSANVIGEIPGGRLKDEVILLGAHVDSWDLGTGAHDDATGVGIITAAAKLIAATRPRPQRTIRVVFYANEEFGLSGARAYAATYQDQIGQHVLGLESDLGAFRPYGLAARVAPEKLPLVRTIQSVLEPLGVPYLGTEASGGADVGQLRPLGMPVMDLKTDAGPYFDLHHTADDTFDKVDPELVRLNVAAFAVIAYLAAEADGGFGRLPVAGKPVE
ncbi:MAG: M20/M25/M40 family metallo-hydrolase [Steroidobacteraceae bacterium]|nr:M20/M25/M40 family metallo-hydrolase [Steroidobacteraceae bacterium]